MSDRKDMIRERLKKISGEEGPIQTILLKVVNRNDGEKTITAEDDDEVQYEDIRLAAILNSNKSIIIYPAAGSFVLCQRIEQDHDWMVIWAEKVDKMSINSGTSIMESDGTKWTIKNNAANLKDVIENIIEAVQQVVVMYGNNPDYAKLATASTLLNELMN